MRIFFVSFMCILFTLPAMIVGVIYSFLKSGFEYGYEAAESLQDGE